MRTDESVPVHDRRLQVEAHVSAATRRLVSDGLPPAIPESARVLFSSYAEMDVPLGKVFECVFDEADARRFEDARSVLVAVTNQFAKGLENVPHGWKTICVVQFPEGVPRLIEELPTTDAWLESPRHVGLCSRETLAARQRSLGTPGARHDRGQRGADNSVAAPVTTPLIARTSTGAWALRLGLIVWALGFCCTLGPRHHQPEPGESPDQTRRILVVRAAFAIFPSVVAFIAVALGAHALMTERERRGAAIGGVGLAGVYLILVWGIGPWLR